MNIMIELGIAIIGATIAFMFIEPHDAMCLGLACIDSVNSLGILGTKRDG